MSRDLAIRSKLEELATKMERDDPQAARVLHELAGAMYSNCTREIGRLLERFVTRMVARSSERSAAG